MKSYYYINLLILFLSINIFAQNKDAKPDVSPFVNERFKLSNFSDQIIVVSIINPNNREEISNLDELAKKYQSSNVAFIAVMGDEANDSVVNSLKYQLTHYQYLSEKENERVFNKYQTGVFKIFPLQIVTNQKDEIHYIKKGRTKNIEGKLSKRLDKLLLAKTKQNALHIAVKSYQNDYQAGKWSSPVSDSQVE
jgi:hypothetical protein